MDQHQENGQLLRLLRQGIKLQHHRRQQKYEYVPGGGKDQGDLHQLFDPFFRRLHIPGPHGLAHDGDEHRPHGRAHQGRHTPETLGHAVGGDLIGAKQGHHAAQRHLHQLEDPALHPVGDGDAQNPPLEVPIQAKDPFFHVAYRIDPGKAEDGNGRRREYSGDQGRPRHPCYPCMEKENSNAVAYHIDSIGGHRDVHGGAGFPEAAVEGGPGVVYGQRRIGVGADAQVGHTGIHHLRLHLAEHQPHDGGISRQGHQGNAHGEQGGGRQQLAGRPARIFPLISPDVLADHHRAAGSQGRKQVDKYGVEGIYQGNSRHGSLPHKSHHKHIRQPHQGHQQLFQKQRQDHPPQSASIHHLRSPPCHRSKAIIRSRLRNVQYLFYIRFHARGVWKLFNWLPPRSEAECRFPALPAAFRPPGRAPRSSGRRHPSPWGRRSRRGCCPLPP